MRASSAAAAVGSMMVIAGTAQAGGHLGARELEPGLRDRDDIVFFEDFEESGWRNHWTWAFYPKNHDAVPTQVFQGELGLEVRAPTGSHNGASLELRFELEGVDEPEELYLRWYVYVPDSWELATDGEIGKFPGFGGTYDVGGWGGTPSDGYNGWSARTSNYDVGELHRLGYYVYHADMLGKTGDHFPWMPDIERNRWTCIEAHARMNTIGETEGNPDGVLRGWIDGELAFEIDDLRMRHVPELKIEKLWFDVYVGGTWTADHDMVVYFDNVVAAYERVGCWVDVPREPDDTGGSGSSSGAVDESSGGSSSSSGPEVNPGTSSGVATDDGGETSSGVPIADDGGNGCSCRAERPIVGHLVPWAVAILGVPRRRRSADRARHLGGDCRRIVA